MDDQRTDRKGTTVLMRKWCWRAAVAALVAASAVALICRRHDEISEYIYFRNHPDETVYSEGFSDKGFRDVHKGMWRRKVIELLGPPLESKDEIGHCFCEIATTQSWTKAKDHGAYRQRTVTYDNDVVMWKLSGAVDPLER